MTAPAVRQLLDELTFDKLAARMVADGLDPYDTRLMDVMPYLRKSVDRTLGALLPEPAPAPLLAAPVARRPKCRCNHWWERRSAGKRYVNARGQCKRTTTDPSGYCSAHRWQAKYAR